MHGTMNVKYLYLFTDGTSPVALRHVVRPFNKYHTEYYGINKRVLAIKLPD